MAGKRNSKDRKMEPDGSRVATLRRTLARLEERAGEGSSGRYRALSALLTDAALAGDEAALVHGQEGLLRVHAQQLLLEPPSLDQAVARGRVLGLLDVVTWTLRRLTPVALLGWLERGGEARRFLEALEELDALTETDMVDRLDSTEEAVAAIGRRLAAAGAVRQSWIDDEALWMITPRGREALSARLTLTLEPDGVERMARQVLEPPWIGGEAEAGRRRGVTSEILAALMASQSPLSLTDLVEDTRYSAGYTRLGLRVLCDHEYIRLAPGDEDRYEVNDNCCVVGISIEPDQLIGVVADLRGQLLRVQERDLERNDPSTIVRAVTSLVRDLRSSSAAPLPEYVIGLGVEVGGHVDARAGKVMFSPHLGWETPVPLQRRLSESTGLSTVVENDVTALATYQQVFGRLGQETSDFAVILISDGVGSGLVVDGDILYGTSGMAGEIGHLVYEPGGRECRCHHFGCVEAYASVEAIRQRSAAEGEPPLATLADVERMLSVGDTRAVRAVADAGEAVGRAISTVENLANPREILVAAPPELTGGGPAARMFAEKVREGRRAHSFSTAADDTLLRIEHIPDLQRQAAVGAVGAVVRRFLKQPLRWRLISTVQPASGVPEPAAPLGDGERGPSAPLLSPAGTGPLAEPAGEDLVNRLHDFYPTSPVERRVPVETP